MSPKASHFLCEECGWASQKWLGRCGKCASWGTVVEASEIRIVNSSETPQPHPLGVSPRGAEILCSQWMVYLGFQGVKVTEFSNDGGVDIEADTAVAQVKLYEGSVGVTEIRELVGVAHVDGKTPIFFTSGSYTKEARGFADSAGVPIFRYSVEQGTLQPGNRAAEQIVIDRNKQ